MTTKNNMAAFLCSVAGVTFNNPDGESRQDIIKNIIEKHTTHNYYSGAGKLVATTYHNPETAFNEPAIEVWMEDKLIGYIPKLKIPEVSKHQRTQSGTVIIQLSFVKQHNTYSAKVFTPNKSAPTKKMEYAVNQILKKDPSLEKPEKTFDAYRKFLNDHKGGQFSQLKYQLNMQKI